VATTWKFDGICACGCGGTTRRAPRNHKALGWIKGEPFEYITQHQNNHKRKGHIEEDCGYETACYVFQGQLSQRYPTFKINGKPKKVHVWAWEQANGPVPPGLVVDHLCNNPRCCRLDHLQVVTQATNTHRGRSSKLTMDKAEQIRRFAAAGRHTHATLAEMYGVSRSSIENVIRGKTWLPVEHHRPHSPARRED
jgi:hypothetical protein